MQLNPALLQVPQSQPTAVPYTQPHAAPFNPYVAPALVPMGVRHSVSSFHASFPGVPSQSVQLMGNATSFSSTTAPSYSSTPVRRNNKMRPYQPTLTLGSFSERPGVDGMPHAGSLLGRSISQAPVSNYHFNFEVPHSTTPGRDTSHTGSRAPTSGAIVRSETNADSSTPPALSLQPAITRGRNSVFNRIKDHVGVAQMPVGSSLQLEECTARCRQEVKTIAQECRAQGKKYCDVDFPPDARSFYINGRSPSTSTASTRDVRVASWKRASEGAISSRPGLSASTWFAKVMGATEVPSETYVPGPLSDVHFLGALSSLRTVGRNPQELIAWYEPEAGVYGIRFFKDGEWMYEILDDALPIGWHGPSCSHVMAGAEVQDWSALLEKAYAKVHGSYEAIMDNTELEALEDVLGFASNRLNVQDFPIWGELWQHMRSKRNRDYVQIAIQGQGQLGETLSSGLLSGHSYPVIRLELVDGEMLIELGNPWPSGSWIGRWGERSYEWASASMEARELLPKDTNVGSRTFWMNIQDFCRHFTDIIEARTVSSHWHSAAVICSTDRPSYPLISVNSITQGIIILTQAERRLASHDDTHCEDDQIKKYSTEYTPIGLHVYRCRVVAPSRNTVGIRQNVSSPFRNLELLAMKPPTKAHSIVIEIAKLEPDCLYIAAIDLENHCPRALLRVLTGATHRFRELSPPESSYFVQAQSSAACAEHDSFSSQGSIDNLNMLGSFRGMDAAFSEVRAAQGWRTGGNGKVSRALNACMASCSDPFQC